jgi:hypothetical protein
VVFGAGEHLYIINLAKSREAEGEAGKQWRGKRRENKMNMIVLIVIIIAVCILAYLLSLSSRSWSRTMSTMYQKAKSLEEAGEYKEACYQYANTILAACGSTSFQKDSHKRIRYLWEKFGPFDYNDKAQSIKSKSELAGHEVLVSIIKGCVSAPK